MSIVFFLWLRAGNASFHHSRCSPFQNSSFITKLVHLTVLNDGTLSCVHILRRQGLTTQCGSESLHLLFHFVLLLRCVESAAGLDKLVFLFSSDSTTPTSFSFGETKWLRSLTFPVKSNMLSTDLLHSVHPCCCIWCISIHCSLSSDLWVVTTDRNRIHSVKRPSSFILKKKEATREASSAGFVIISL